MLSAQRAARALPSAVAARNDQLASQVEDLLTKIDDKIRPEYHETHKKWTRSMGMRSLRRFGPKRTRRMQAVEARADARLKAHGFPTLMTAVTEMFDRMRDTTDARRKAAEHHAECVRVLDECVAAETAAVTERARLERVIQDKQDVLRRLLAHVTRN